jgi:hypothetical protein
MLRDAACGPGPGEVVPNDGWGCKSRVREARVRNCKARPQTDISQDEVTVRSGSGSVEGCPLSHTRGSASTHGIDL